MISKINRREFKLENSVSKDKDKYLECAISEVTLQIEVSKIGIPTANESIIHNGQFLGLY